MVNLYDLIFNTIFLGLPDSQNLATCSHKLVGVGSSMPLDVVHMVQ